MWANIYSSLVVVVYHMAVKLKREADSLEVDIQICIIKPVTFSKNVFMGSVVNNICMTRHILKRLTQIPSHE